MPRYRNKPVEFDAIQFRGGEDGTATVLAWLDAIGPTPEFASLDTKTGVLRLSFPGERTIPLDPGYFLVKNRVYPAFTTAHPVNFRRDFEEVEVKRPCPSSSTGCPATPDGPASATSSRASVATT